MAAPRLLFAVRVGQPNGRLQYPPRSYDDMSSARPAVARQPSMMLMSCCVLQDRLIAVTASGMHGRSKHTWAGVGRPPGRCCTYQCSSNRLRNAFGCSFRSISDSVSPMQVAEWLHSAKGLWTLTSTSRYSRLRRQRCRRRCDASHYLCAALLAAVSRRVQAFSEACSARVEVMYGGIGDSPLS